MNDIANGLEDMFEFLASVSKILLFILLLPLIMAVISDYIKYLNEDGGIYE